MAENITPFSITAPGFFGLNTADAPVDMNPQFALEAGNCVIDKYGRVGARKGWTPTHTTSAALGSNYVEAIGECVENSGTRTIVCAGNGKLFKLVGTTLTHLTYGGGGVAPTITTNNWQITSLNGAAVFFQQGYDPLLYEPSVSATTFIRISEHTTYSGTVPQGNCVVSAFGRLWAARTSTDKQTVAWTDLLQHQKWSGGSAGTLNLVGVWPHGGDEIVALAAHNNRLFIFGSKQILIYTGANNPSTMALEDSIAMTGCVGRDTVANTGDDVIFLSDNGVRSVLRTIQEKSAPIRNISKNVNSDIIDYLNNEGGGETIKAVYSPNDSFYLLTFVDSNTTYCFDMKSPLQDGSARTTVWMGIRPKAYFYSKDRILYLGMNSWLGKYDTYYDNGAQYRMSYYTSWVDFGNPMMTSILKRVIMTLYGTLNQTVVYKWAFDYNTAEASSQPSVITDTSVPAEYGIAEYGIAEFTRNLIVKTLSVPASGGGKVIQIGFEAQIQGYAISIQRVDIYTKDGKL